MKSQSDQIQDSLQVIECQLRVYSVEKLENWVRRVFRQNSKLPKACVKSQICSIVLTWVVRTRFSYAPSYQKA